MEFGLDPEHDRMHLDTVVIAADVPILQVVAEERPDVTVAPLPERPLDTTGLFEEETDPASLSVPILAAPPLSTAAGGPPLPTLSCYRHGPLSGETEQAVLSDWFTSRGIENYPYRSEKPAVNLYMAYVRMPDSVSATRYMEELLSRGVQDIRMVGSSGGYQDISLGVFSSYSSAERHLRSLAVENVQAEIASYGMSQTETQYWLDVVLDQQSITVAEEWLDAEVLQDVTINPVSEGCSSDAESHQTSTS